VLILGQIGGAVPKNAGFVGTTIWRFMLNEGTISIVEDPTATTYSDARMTQRVPQF
jgi:hypothetical protein